MTGLVMYAFPVKHANIKIYKLDSRTGALIDTRPVNYTTTDENGEFEIRMTDVSGTLLVTVDGGSTQEYWLDDEVPLTTNIHLTAVISYWALANDRQVTITPWTTLADAMSEHQNKNGSPEIWYMDRVSEINDAVYGHIIDSLIRPDVTAYQCKTNLTCLKPIQVDELQRALDTSAVESPEILYTASLLSLAGLSHTRCEVYYSRVLGKTCKTKYVIDDLLVDIGDDGLLNGDPIANTTVDTLRSELVHGAVDSYWGSDANGTPLGVDDLTFYFCKIVRSKDPIIFGTVSLKSIDRCSDAPIHSEHEKPGIGSFGEISAPGKLFRSTSRSTHGDSGLTSK